MVRGAAAAQHAVRQQGGARGRFQVGGHLQRDPLLEAVQQRVRQAEHAGAVGAVGIQRNAEQETDDEADAAERQANAQQRPAPPCLLGQRIEVYIDHVHASYQRHRSLLKRCIA